MNARQGEGFNCHTRMTAQAWQHKHVACTHQGRFGTSPQYNTVAGCEGQGQSPAGATSLKQHFLRA